MTGRVTIIDVAKEAGVSFKTVSNVLNGTGSMRPATRQKVERAIAKLGYSVNASARSLRSGTTGLIGLLLFDFSQPFAPYLADQVIAHAQRRGYGTIISTYAHSHTSGGTTDGSLERAVRHAAQLAADGWIVFLDHPLAHRGAILRQPYPLVMAGDYRSYGQADCATMPNVEAVRHATGRLLDAGCRRVALFGAPQTAGLSAGSDRASVESAANSATDSAAHPVSDPASDPPESASSWVDRLTAQKEGTRELRVRGYVEAFLQRGLTPNRRLIVPSGPLMSSSGERVVQTMMERDIRPDAIVCVNDALALGTLHALERHGLRVPLDVQLVGFDNVPDSRYSTPSLTTIDPHISEYARQAVEMLIDRIHGDQRPARTYVSDFDLVERESTRL